MLDAIDPECQPTVIGTHCGRCPPVDLHEVRRIADREPVRERPGRAIVYQRSSKLVSARGLAEFQAHHLRCSAYEAFEDVMGFAASHRDRVRVEVEARPVARLGIGAVIADVDRVGIVDDRLQTLAAHQCGCSADTEITYISGIGRPGRQAARFEPIRKDQI